jgi:poly-gamma-glutamate synthesis protein (capsule biosynthesis protein)
VLHNDHGLLFLVELKSGRARRIEAVPLKLEYAYTRLAHGSEAEWIRQRFQRACSELGTEVLEEDGRLVVYRED